MSKGKRRFSLFWPIVRAGLLLCAAGSITVQAAAQEPSLEDLLPAFKDQAIVVDIVARVVEQDQEEIWNSVNSKVTISGRPVGIKLVGANIIVVVQFTPYLRADGKNVLVAQGQIWINVPNQGMSYQTAMQTIPLEFGEQAYFFPLGSVSSDGEAYIEIQLALHPYMRAPLPPLIEVAPDVPLTPPPEAAKAPS
ncbi:MAG: hypothetical protein LBS86_07325 [Treponema sp.]|jgi:hypothetical protein|nr:hypothetical protein [Treponema sp.]